MKRKDAGLEIVFQFVTPGLYRLQHDVTTVLDRTLRLNERKGLFGRDRDVGTHDGEIPSLQTQIYRLQALANALSIGRFVDNEESTVGSQAGSIVN